MIVSFIGCPRSGKTTTAARVFSNLKEAGFATEFIPEQARLYIAEKRVSEGLKATDKLILNDEDQLLIMEKQVAYEKLMLSACGEGAIVVTDSSPLNAILYMSKASRELPIVQGLVASSLNRPTVYLYANPVPWLGGLDPNRIHTHAESIEVDERIQQLILPIVGDIHWLTGDFDTRWRTATSVVMNTIMSR